MKIGLMLTCTLSLTITLAEESQPKGVTANLIPEVFRPSRDELDKILKRGGPAAITIDAFEAYDIRFFTVEIENERFYCAQKKNGNTTILGDYDAFSKRVTSLADNSCVLMLQTSDSKRNVFRGMRNKVFEKKLIWVSSDRDAALVKELLDGLKLAPVKLGAIVRGVEAKGVVWRQLAGPPVKMLDPDSVFTYFIPTEPGKYIFELRATVEIPNENGKDSTIKEIKDEFSVEIGGDKALNRKKE